MLSKKGVLILLTILLGFSVQAAEQSADIDPMKVPQVSQQEIKEALPQEKAAEQKSIAPEEEQESLAEVPKEVTKSPEPPKPMVEEPPVEEVPEQKEVAQEVKQEAVAELPKEEAVLKDEQMPTAQEVKQETPAEVPKEVAEPPKLMAQEPAVEKPVEQKPVEPVSQEGVVEPPKKEVPKETPVSPEPPKKKQKLMVEEPQPVEQKPVEQRVAEMAEEIEPMVMAEKLPEEQVSVPTEAESQTVFGVDEIGVLAIDDVDINRKSKESKRLVLNALKHFQKLPVAQACNDFIHNNIWRKGELFVFVYTADGTCLAHGDDHGLIWQNISKVKGIAGDPLVNDMLAVGKKGGRLSFLWNNGYQTAYVRTIIKGGKKYIIGCGFYPESDEYTTKQLVKTAVTYFYQNGKEATFALINNPTGPFVKGDIYMFAYDLQGVNVAHGQNAALVGQNLVNLKDPRGTSVIKDLVDMARLKGKGWVEYNWRNEFKRSYLEKVVDPKTKTEYLISAGYYPDINLETVKTYVNGAIRFLKANGAKLAFAEFSSVVGEFSQGGLGIYVLDHEGKCLANGENPGFVGQNLMRLSSQDGRFFVKDMIDLAIKHGSALISFMRQNANAVSYVQSVDIPDGKFIIGAEFFPSSKTASTQTLVNRAVERLRDTDSEIAFGTFSARDNDFTRGDLTIFVYDEDGTRLVNGTKKAQVWKNLLRVTDQQGKMVINDLITVAINGGGWTEYRTRNATRKVFVKAVPKRGDGDKVTNYIVGSGYFL